MVSNFFLAIYSFVSSDSPAVLGVDETVTTPTHADATYVRKARVALELDDNAPLFKLRYMTTKGIFLIVSASHRLWATTRQHVEPPVSERCALMKDIWRVSLDGMQTEGAIYMRLHVSVSNISLFLRGDDVTSPFCCTHSHNFAGQFGLKLRPHSHSRLILDDIGDDLTSFTMTKELVETMAGALEGKRNENFCFRPPLTPHTETFEKAGILHRDISPDNIVISDRGGS